jgi:quercetin dioxygenase-like cupin family protein
MAQPHASSGDVIDVHALGATFHDHVTHALIKSAQLELVRLVLPAGKALREHSVAGEITVLCVEGLIDLQASGMDHRLAAGQLIHLAAAEPHTVRAVTDASALLTICLAVR